MKIDLSRFHKAHELHFNRALKEIKNGKKESHWMWFIFPQVDGLGHSSMSSYYSIKSIDEALCYLHDPILREHLLEICSALLALDVNNINDVFKYPDDLKLKSSLTLFDFFEPNFIFEDLLNKFFEGEKDDITLHILDKFEKGMKKQHLKTFQYFAHILERFK